MSQQLNQPPNTKPNDQSSNTPAQLPQGDGSSPESPTNGGDGDGKGKKTISLESLDPDLKAFFESELRKTRKAAAAEAKKQAETEAENKAREDAEKAAREAGNFEALLRTETENHLNTKANLAKVTTELRKVKAAIKAEIPNPLVNYMRLIDSDDDEALATDAKVLKESFGVVAHRDPNTPPATPDGKGGKLSESATPNEKKEIDDKKIKDEIRGTKFYSRM